jgi:hypothetical protein
MIMRGLMVNFQLGNVRYDLVIVGLNFEQSFSEAHLSYLIIFFIATLLTLL